MARRSDPARIDEANRAAMRNRLISSGLDDETADAWIAAWEDKAAEDGLERGAAYWDAGWAWIAASASIRCGRRKTPTALGDGGRCA